MKDPLKHLRLSLPLLVSFFFHDCLGQQKDSVDLVKNGLYQPVYKLCREQAVDFSIRWGYQLANVPTPKTYFYRVTGSKANGNCHTEVIETIYDNNTLQLEGNSVNVISKATIENNWTYKVKFTNTGRPTISWKEVYNYTANDCGYESREITYKGSYPTIYSIPPPPAPTLTALKGVVLFPESTTIISSGCPNTVEGETGYFYTLDGACEDWAFKCASDGQPDFKNAARTNYTNNWLVYNSYYGYYKSGTVFRARCTDNGCVGEVSDPVAIGTNYASPSCNDPKMNEIDSYTNDGRPDYHYYTTETVVCNKSGDPNCTQANVFKLLKSSKVFAAPAAIDFTPTNYVLSGTAVGQLSTKVSLVGSKLLFNENQSPVSNCETANLAGPAGLLLNFLAMTKGIAAFALAYQATAGTPVANPVAQFIDEPSFSVTNYTQQGHILYPGKTTRIVVDACDQIKIITIGTGRSWLWDRGWHKSAILLKELNIFSGKNVLFPNADARLKQAYVESYK